jgi:hypothetical protein
MVYVVRFSAYVYSMKNAQLDYTASIEQILMRN